MVIAKADILTLRIRAGWAKRTRHDIMQLSSSVESG
jgi:hypothetical protein